MKAPITSGPSSRHPTVAWLAIWGMDCPDCQARVNDALQRLPGVLDVEVDLVYMGARVVILPEEVSIDDLVACVGAVDTHADYQLWASAGPEVSRALQLTWELRGLHQRIG